MKKEITRNQKGITLIALVVTIVILLILAGISINAVIGENGLISKARDAKAKTEQDAVNTEKALNNLYDEMTAVLEGTGGNGGGNQLPSTDYTMPYLPTGFSKVEGTDLSNGLVIQDGSGNQYVWVEVPKTETVYPTAGITLDLDTLTDTALETAYTNIETDLHTYTSTYRNGTSFTDTYYADTDNTGWFADETAYNTAKQNMLKSVYKNGGFYVGRYETGIAYDDANGPRIFDIFASDEIPEAIQTPVIKANAYPYTWVTRTQAQVLASNMNSGNRTSSLMFGVQWDLVLAFMHNQGGVEDSLLTSDSTTIGNFYNATFDVINTNAKYAIETINLSELTYEFGWNNISTSYTKPDSGTENFILLTTGANETRNSKMNICDIAGNVCEWTLEYPSGTGGSCAHRGGDYGGSGSKFPASYRGIYGTTYSHSNGGFRVALY